MTATGDLCSRCGLCCSGWLYHQTRLTVDESKILARFVVINETPAGPMMPQPCALHTGSSCSQYESRPAPCRSFACASLAAHQRGELTFDEADARLARAVSAMRALQDALRASGWLTGNESGSAAWRRLVKTLAEADDPIEFRRTHSRVLLAGAVAETIARRAVGDYF